MTLRVVCGYACAAMVSAALVSMRAETAWSDETTAAGLNDLVILDPGAHERGLPAVELKYLEGGQQIDIPPKVHVHRYYYSGDKIFQGPIIQGGPTVVVANHPKTGARLYIDAVLPAGAPRIEHTQNSINYIYNQQRVEIKFRHFPFDPGTAIVKHHSGKGIARSVGDAREHLREGVKEKLTKSQLVNSIKDVSAEGADIVVGVGTSIGQISSQGADTVKQLSNMIPGVTYLKSLGEQGPQKSYQSSVHRAELRNARQETPFVRTNQ